MHFTAVEIPPEKHPDAYREIVERHALATGSTWMIGNSPRSDINPALAAGLHAVSCIIPTRGYSSMMSLHAPRHHSALSSSTILPPLPSTFDGGLPGPGTH